MSCECYAECPLPWSTITVHLVLDNLHTIFIDNNSVTPMYSTETLAIDATIIYNRVTLSSKGVVHAIAMDVGTTGALGDLLDLGEFFLISTGCCPCQWHAIIATADPVAGGTNTYHSDGITADPNVGTIAAFDLIENLTVTVPLQLLTQNAACGQKTWPDQEDTWPFDPRFNMDDGAVLWAINDGTYLAWDIQQATLGTISNNYIAARAAGWSTRGVFLYPVDEHQGASGNQISYDATAEGTGHGFGDSCAVTMDAAQECEWESMRLLTPTNSPNDGRDYASGVGSGSLSIAIA